MAEATHLSAVHPEEVNHLRDIPLLQASTGRVLTEAPEEAIPFHHEAALKDQGASHQVLHLPADLLHHLHIVHQVPTLQVHLQVHPVLHQAAVQEAVVAAAAAVAPGDSLNNKMEDKRFILNKECRDCFT